MLDLQGASLVDLPHVHVRHIAQRGWLEDGDVLAELFREGVNGGVLALARQHRNHSRVAYRPLPGGLHWKKRNALLKS